MLYFSRFRAKHIIFRLQKHYYSTPGSGSSSNISIVDPKLLNYTKLINRSIIRLKGSEVDTFLQGLLTNDVKAHFKSRSRDSNYSVMYTYMLNTQGRVLYDLLMYVHFKNGGEILLECDRDLQSEIVKTLKTYRLRKKIDIDSLDQELQIFSVYFDDLEKNDSKSIKMYLKNLNLNKSAESDPIFCSDPRISNLGCRVVLRNDIKSGEFFEKINEKPIDNYRRRRYALGIGEGSSDLPVGNCFPLESNGDYLNGVSFHKGCYVGQELTARTHHTGVVRKRLMPLFFDQSIQERVKPDAKILADDRPENIGKFRSGQDNVGLALLRVEEALKAKELYVLTSDAQKLACKTKKPDWWLNNSTMAGEVHVNAQPAKA